MVFVFPRLPYEYNALEPFLDSLTMDLHHTKHHQTYVNQTNLSIQTEQNGDLKDMSLVEVIQNAKSEKIRSNAGRHYNHSLFWTWMTTPGTANTEPYRSLNECIEQDFGSLDEMKAQFNAATRFGSGWVGLGGKKDGKLAITSTMNQDNPLMPNVQEPMIPILDLDGWEHAYSLQYQNRRTEYIRGVLERGQLGPGRALLRGVCRQAGADPDPR
ncbi:hypothetical protein Gpo141_00008240 [Globisporangium polare]